MTVDHFPSPQLATLETPFPTLGQAFEETSDETIEARLIALARNQARKTASLDPDATLVEGQELSYRPADPKINKLRVNGILDALGWINVLSNNKDAIPSSGVGGNSKAKPKKAAAAAVTPNKPAGKDVTPFTPKKGGIVVNLLGSEESESSGSDSSDSDDDEDRDQIDDEADDDADDKANKKEDELEGDVRTDEEEEDEEGESSEKTHPSDSDYDESTTSAHKKPKRAQKKHGKRGKKPTKKNFGSGSKQSGKKPSKKTKEQKKRAAIVRPSFVDKVGLGHPDPPPPENDPQLCYTDLWNPGNEVAAFCHFGNYGSKVGVMPLDEVISLSKTSRFQRQYEAILRRDRKYLNENFTIQWIELEGAGVVASLSSVFPAEEKSRVLHENRKFMSARDAIPNAGTGERRIYRCSGPDLDRNFHLQGSNTTFETVAPSEMNLYVYRLMEEIVRPRNLLVAQAANGRTYPKVVLSLKVEIMGDMKASGFSWHFDRAVTENHEFSQEFVEQTLTERVEKNRQGTGQPDTDLEHVFKSFRSSKALFVPTLSLAGCNDGDVIADLCYSKVNSQGRHGRITHQLPITANHLHMQFEGVNDGMYKHAIKRKCPLRITRLVMTFRAPRKTSDARITKVLSEHLGRQKDIVVNTNAKHELEYAYKSFRLGMFPQRVNDPGYIRPPILDSCRDTFADLPPDGILENYVSDPSDPNITKYLPPRAAKTIDFPEHIANILVRGETMSRLIEEKTCVEIQVVDTRRTAEQLSTTVTHGRVPVMKVAEFKQQPPSLLKVFSGTKHRRPEVGDYVSSHDVCAAYGVKQSQTRAMFVWPANDKTSLCTNFVVLSQCYKQDTATVRYSENGCQWTKRDWVVEEIQHIPSSSFESPGEKQSTLEYATHFDEQTRRAELPSEKRARISDDSSGSESRGSVPRISAGGRDPDMPAYFMWKKSFLHSLDRDVPLEFYIYGCGGSALTIGNKPVPSSKLSHINSLAACIANSDQDLYKNRHNKAIQKVCQRNGIVQVFALVSSKEKKSFSPETLKRFKSRDFTLLKYLGCAVAKKSDYDSWVTAEDVQREADQLGLDSTSTLYRSFRLGKHLGVKCQMLPVTTKQNDKEWSTIKVSVPISETCQLSERVGFIVPDNLRPTDLEAHDRKYEFFHEHIRTISGSDSLSGAVRSLVDSSSSQDGVSPSGAPAPTTGTVTCQDFINLTMHLQAACAARVCFQNIATDRKSKKKYATFLYQAEFNDICATARLNPSTSPLRSFDVSTSGLMAMACKADHYKYFAEHYPYHVPGHGMPPPCVRRISYAGVMQSGDAKVAADMTAFLELFFFNSILWRLTGNPLPFILYTIMELNGNPQLLTPKAAEHFLLFADWLIGGTGTERIISILTGAQFFQSLPHFYCARTIMELMQGVRAIHGRLFRDDGGIHGVFTQCLQNATAHNGDKRLKLVAGVAEFFDSALTQRGTGGTKPGDMAFIGNHVVADMETLVEFEFGETFFVPIGSGARDALNLLNVEGLEDTITDYEPTEDDKMCLQFLSSLQGGQNIDPDELQKLLRKCRILEKQFATVPEDQLPVCGMLLVGDTLCEGWNHKPISIVYVEHDACDVHIHVSHSKGTSSSSQPTFYKDYCQPMPNQHTELLAPGLQYYANKILECKTKLTSNNKFPQVHELFLRQNEETAAQRTKRFSHRLLQIVGSRSYETTDSDGNDGQDRAEVSPPETRFPYDMGHMFAGCSGSEEIQDLYCSKTVTDEHVQNDFDRLLGDKLVVLNPDDEKVTAWLWDTFGVTIRHMEEEAVQGADALMALGERKYRNSTNTTTRMQVVNKNLGGGNIRYRLFGADHVEGREAESCTDNLTQLAMNEKTDDPNFRDKVLALRDALLETIRDATNRQSPGVAEEVDIVYKASYLCSTEPGSRGREDTQSSDPHAVIHVGIQVAHNDLTAADINKSRRLCAGDDCGGAMVVFAALTEDGTIFSVWEEIRLSDKKTGYKQWVLFLPSRVSAAIPCEVWHAGGYCFGSLCNPRVQLLGIPYSPCLDGAEDRAKTIIQDSQTNAAIVKFTAPPEIDDDDDDARSVHSFDGVEEYPAQSVAYLKKLCCTLLDHGPMKPKTSTNNIIVDYVD